MYADSIYGPEGHCQKLLQNADLVMQGDGVGQRESGLILSGDIQHSHRIYAQQVVVTVGLIFWQQPRNYSFLAKIILAGIMAPRAALTNPAAINFGRGGAGGPALQEKKRKYLSAPNFFQ